ncbi:ASCH domain-containing protein [Roseofilum casamattae]|uniref:ASCH domain-containing protein n=1 Tax=Roseofilum casamattae BLCC-M143 TaxID=3022442 RepID=A0ABT7BT30_9CYAN|nr:ASCH domain-containing protein [Roseofilum casamattae]MDJ1182338.1 ASCH domain-containing protein [Roseofilum casamattae BLCC-M143]
MKQEYPKVLLLSIKPQYVQKILDGQKNIELRKTRPKLKKGDFILVYESSPTKCLRGWFKVQSISCKDPQKLWHKVQDNVGITKAEFDDYYKKSKVAVAIAMKSVYSTKLSLQEVRETWESFKPPQNFYYLKKEEIILAEKIIGFDIIDKSANLQLTIPSVKH